MFDRNRFGELFCWLVDVFSFMCYWVGTKNVRKEMLRRLDKQPDDEIAQLYYKTFVGKSEMRFREYYVAVGKAGAEITVMLYSSEKGLYYRNMKWGLQWSYHDSKTGKRYSRELINSTCENVFFVHKEVVFSRRCIILLDGYFEFFHFSGQVYPYFIYPSRGIFYAAGVWSEEVDEETGELLAGFSIITTPPNDLTKKLHNNPKSPNGSRMLLLLTEDKIMNYLNPDASKEQLKELFKPYSDKNMEAYPTVRFLKKEFADKINTEEVRKKIDYPELIFA